MPPYKRSYDGEFVMPSTGSVRSYGSVVQKKSAKKQTIGGFSLPQNWLELCCKLLDPKGMNKFKAVYKGYRTRQILQEWRAARYMSPGIDREVLWARLEVHRL